MAKKNIWDTQQGLLQPDQSVPIWPTHINPSSNPSSPASWNWRRCLLVLRVPRPLLKLPIPPDDRPERPTHWPWRRTATIGCGKIWILWRTDNCSLTFQMHLMIHHHHSPSKRTEMIWNAHFCCLENEIGSSSLGCPRNLCHNQKHYVLLNLSCITVHFSPQRLGRHFQDTAGSIRIRTDGSSGQMYDHKNIRNRTWKGTMTMPILEQCYR